MPATDAVVIDGKEVCGAKLMRVHAVAQPSQRGLGVEPVAAKPNEIPTARTLRQRLPLTGRLVELDGRHIHYPLDVGHREDESRVRQPNAASVLGLFRRLANAFKEPWAPGRPKRRATARDWIEEHHFNRWLGIRLFTGPALAKKTQTQTRPPPLSPLRIPSLMQP